MEKEVVLAVEGLSKQYKDFNAVEKVTFTVNKGEIFGLLGPNGAGKTTTIKMLCGLLKADSGSVHLGGFSMVSHYQKLKGKIGLCPQEIVIWELLTCYEQLMFVGNSYGLTHQEATNQATYLLQTLGLWDKRDKLGRTLSGGMQRRLNIALALIHDPELIILDEPQAGLDPQSKILVRDFIRQIGKEKTVILTTHDMDEADRLMDRVAIMDHGKILLIDTPDKLKDKSGRSDLLQIRTDKLTDKVVDLFLQSLPSEFTEKKYSDGLFLLSASEILVHISCVNEALKKLKVEPKDMIIRKRTLEDVFIDLTGRGLRE